ncbi:MAG: Rid family detoxifying hydrolase [Propionibacteriaceae bacterium]|nr:Rid family detoxifying hydrolase [Propionibacteriaceae bacterium]
MATSISTTHAPAAVGPYSQGVDTGSFVFCSCQIPIDPKIGKIKVYDIEQQAAQVFANLAAVLEEAGLGLDAVVKTTLFLVDISDFGAVNEVYARWFTGDPLPARSAIQVSGLPKGALIGIEAIAMR